MQASILPPSLPKATGASSSPLALLLATANKPAAPLPLLPLAPLVKPTGVRIKRKPQISKFRPKDRKRFRPRGRVTESSVTKVPGDDDEKKEEEEEEENRIKEKNIDPTAKLVRSKLSNHLAANKIKSRERKVQTRFSAFGRRPKPGVVGLEGRQEEVKEELVVKKRQEVGKVVGDWEKDTTLPHRKPTTVQVNRC